MRSKGIFGCTIRNESDGVRVSTYLFDAIGMVISFVRKAEKIKKSS